MDQHISHTSQTEVDVQICKRNAELLGSIDSTYIHIICHFTIASSIRKSCRCHVLHVRFNATDWQWAFSHLLFAISVHWFSVIWAIKLAEWVVYYRIPIALWILALTLATRVRKRKNFFGEKSRSTDELYKSIKMVIVTVVIT